MDVYLPVVSVAVTLIVVSHKLWVVDIDQEPLITRSNNTTRLSSTGAVFININMGSVNVSDDERLISNLSPRGVVDEKNGLFLFHRLKSSEEYVKNQEVV